MKLATRYLTAFAITATTAVFSALTPIAPAVATQFQQQEVNQNNFVAVAAPAGRVGHQLLILEQLNNTRSCWQESGSGPTQIEPLLLQFDFTGICGRSTDSNGYSVRVGGQDLGWRYSLRVVEQGSDLVLMAVSTVDRSAPGLEVGRTNGLTDGFARITLNPGWRLTRRAYNGQAVGHVYLTNDQNLDTLIAAAAPIRPPVTTPTTPTRPTTPTIPTTPTLPATPTTPATPAPPASDELALQMGFSHRVVVPSASAADLVRVRSLVPDAFRVSMNGREVIQAGLFRDRASAEALEFQLRRENLLAQVLQIPGTPASPGTQPTTPVPPTTPSPGNLPPSPNSQVVVVIDPGHGGSDPGAVGIGGLRETDINLSISQQVATLLARQGVQVVMTRRDERTLELAPRVDIAENANANVFVSIHANASVSEANGVETYYYASGAQLATAIQTSITESLDVTDRGVKQARFYVLRQTSMPAALVEVGFVTGRQDAAQLSSTTYRTQMAEAIARGILRYLQG